MDRLRFATKAPKLCPLFESAVERDAATTTQWLGADRIAWLQRLPQIERRGPLATATDAELESVYGVLGAAIAVYDHIHTPFVRPLGGFIVANSGSVGLPYDGETRASYLLLDESRVDIRLVEYDIESECRVLHRSGLPHASWVAQIIRAGRYVPPS